jgi:hypothetical protein
VSAWVEELGEIERHQWKQEDQERIAVVGECALLNEAVDEAEEDAGEEGIALPVPAPGDGVAPQSEQNEPRNYEWEQGRDAVEEDEAEGAVAKAGVEGDNPVEAVEEGSDGVLAQEEDDGNGWRDEIGEYGG